MGVKYAQIAFKLVIFDKKITRAIFAYYIIKYPNASSLSVDEAFDFFINHTNSLTNKFTITVSNAIIPMMP